MYNDNLWPTSNSISILFILFILLFKSNAETNNKYYKITKKKTTTKQTEGLFTIIVFDKKSGIFIKTHAFPASMPLS